MATIESPPLHRLFSSDRLSPVLKCRKEQCEKASASTANSTPTFNFTIGHEALNILWPLVTQSNLLLPAQSAAHTLGDLGLDRLLPPSREIGPEMKIADFARKYDLDPSIVQKLVKNGFKKMCSFRHLSIDDLKGIQFKIGEIYAL